MRSIDVAGCAGVHPKNSQAGPCAVPRGLEARILRDRAGHRGPARGLGRQVAAGSIRLGVCSCSLVGPAP